MESARVMTAALDLRTLVLNADYRPMSTWPLSLIPGRDAISAVFRDRAVVLDEWPAVLRSATRAVNVPKVIALTEYVSVHARPNFCRRSILLRDRFNCQYCGGRFAAVDLTFDHVIPRCRGGKTTWENILSACVPCNTSKKDRMPGYSGRKNQGQHRPLKEPRQPTSAELMRAGLEFLGEDIRETWGDYLYWSAPLQP